MTRVVQWTLGSLYLPQIAQASLTPRQKSGDSYLVILVLVVVLASLSELFGRHDKLHRMSMMETFPPLMFPLQLDF